MTAREDVIRAGIEALYTGRAAQGYKTPLKTLVTCVVDAVEPIIRADERERLRAQVEALPFTFMGRGPQVLRSDVLALLGGESDE